MATLLLSTDEPAERLYERRGILDVLNHFRGNN